MSKNYFIPSAIKECSQFPFPRKCLLKKTFPFKRREDKGKNIHMLVAWCDSQREQSSCRIEVPLKPQAFRRRTIVFSYQEVWQQNIPCAYLQLSPKFQILVFKFYVITASMFHSISIPCFFWTKTAMEETRQLWYAVYHSLTIGKY